MKTYAVGGGKRALGGEPAVAALSEVASVGARGLLWRCPGQRNRPEGASEFEELLATTTC